MPKILACTDGSQYAPSIYDHTAWAARRLDAAVTVLHMLDPHHEHPPSADSSGAIGLGAKAQLLDELVEIEAQQARLASQRGNALLEVAREHLSAAGLTDLRLEQRHGTLPEMIESLEADADLVILGKRGEKAGFESKHLGQNLERVVRGCHHPVLLAAREFRPVERFLIAFDGEENAQKAVAFAEASPLLAGLTARLVLAGTPHAREQSRLDDAAARLRAAGFTVEVKVAPGKPTDVIAAQVTEHNSDLLLMGAYQHPHWQHLFIGSTTSDIIRRCKTPILLFR